MSRKPNPEHESFLEELFETIISKNLKYSEITKLAKEKNIKGLINERIRTILKEKGIEYDELSKRWIHSSEIKDNTIVGPAITIPPTSDIATSNNNNVIEDVPESVENSFSDLSANNSLNPPDNSKQIEELSERLSKQEALIQELLLKISQIESRLLEKSEEPLRKVPSYITLGFQQFLELNYSSGKRYEATLREDLVNKATEMLQKRHPELSIDLTKSSRLFEAILLDYINF